MQRFTRRTFVAWVGGASAGFYLFGRLPGTSATAALAQIPGGTLDPLGVPKFQTPMLVPPVMPRAGTITQRGGKPVDYYEISMKQIVQQILPTGFPTTTVWGYGGKSAHSNRGLLLHHAPSLTIEAGWKRPVRVTWINELGEIGETPQASSHAGSRIVGLHRYPSTRAVLPQRRTAAAARRMARES